MSEYLVMAAKLIVKAIETSEHSYSSPGTLIENRMKFATAYAMLGAIDKGLLPEPIAEQVYDQFKTLTSR